MKNIVRIKLINQCAGKLQFVKSVKELLDLDLRSSKDIVDNICNQPFKSVELEIPMNKSISDVKELLDDLHWTIRYGEDEMAFYNYEINGGVQWQREANMLKLGIGTRQDYLDFIKQSIQTNFGNSEELITFVLNKLSDEQLKETLEKIEY
jgi:hypothetical protein